MMATRCDGRSEPGWLTWKNPLPAPEPPNLHEKPQDRIDRSVRALPLTRRHGDRKHLRFVARQHCIVCGRQPCDHTTRDLRKLASLDKKSATNLWSSYAGPTIANCTVQTRK